MAVAAGDFPVAPSAVEAALAAALDSGNRDAEGWLAHPAGLVALWRGDGDEACAHADRLASGPGMPGGRLGRARALHVRGLVALVRDEPFAAVHPLLAAVDLVGDDGLAHPGAEPVLHDLVIALVAAGRTDEAEVHRARLAEQAGRLGLPRTDALASWADGVVAVARGDVDGGLSALSAAATLLEDLGLRPEAFRCRLDEGRAARRVGLRARAARSLATARASFADMGAHGWATLAATDLERVAPGTTAGELTSTEVRVAALVAGGATNREVAGSAFMAVSTVEAHLTRIYRKLGIRSRTDLVRLVADGHLDLSGAVGADGAEAGHEQAEGGV